MQERNNPENESDATNSVTPVPRVRARRKTLSATELHELRERVQNKNTPSKQSTPAADDQHETGSAAQNTKNQTQNSETSGSKHGKKTTDSTPPLKPNPQTDSTPTTNQTGENSKTGSKNTNKTKKTKTTRKTGARTPDPQNQVNEKTGEPISATPQTTAGPGRHGATPKTENTPILSVQRARERGIKASKNPIILRVKNLTRTFDELVAADNINFAVHEGSFFGVVGPNGAGKTTTLSMISGLLRPSAGTVTIRELDVWQDSPAAKHLLGILPDRLRLFDRLTGAQLLYYHGVLQGVKEDALAARLRELAQAFALEAALDRQVTDYSAGMQKKIALACSLIHAPQVLVLDEPFEAIDPVSAANVTDILEKFVAAGGSVIMSSHSLDLIQRTCDHIAIINEGQIVAEGPVDEVRAGLTLEERFMNLVGVSEKREGLRWLQGLPDSE